MSMPNIPDITPEINITFDDAINLLLKSIADEELSLSKLMDAEKDKILYVLNKYKNNGIETGELLSVNNSVDKTVTDLIKMQMLLQFKLDSVKNLITAVNTCPVSPQPCASKPCKIKNIRYCLVMGKIKGKISNQSDKFYRNRAILEMFVSSYNCKNSVINYYAGEDYDSLCMTVYSNNINIKIECPCETRPGKVKLWGNAKLTKTSISEQKKIIVPVSFELFVWDDKSMKNGFQMIIKSTENQEIVHNSGFVESCAHGKGMNLYCFL